jgi:hypothetical protein
MANRMVLPLEDPNQWNAPEPIKTLDQKIVQDALPAIQNFASGIPAAVANFSSNIAPPDAPPGIPGTVFNPNPPGIKGSDIVPTWSSGGASADWGPSGRQLLTEAQDLNKSFTSSMNRTSDEARAMLSPADQKKYVLPDIPDTSGSSFLPSNVTRMGKDTFVKNVLPDGTISLSGGPGAGWDNSQAGMDKRNAARDMSGAGDIMSTMNTALMEAMNNPTRKNRNKAALAIQAFQAMTMHQNSLEAAKRTEQPSFHALGAGQMGYTLDPVTGKLTQVADNMQPLLDKQAEAQKGAAARQGFTAVHDAYKAYGKNWMDITKTFAEDPAAKEENLRALNNQWFASMGVPETLSKIPVNFQTYLDLETKGKGAKGEELAKYKNWHSRALQLRQGFMDKKFQAMGYHEGNRPLAQSQSYLPPIFSKSDEE